MKRRMGIGSDSREKLAKVLQVAGGTVTTAVVSGQLGVSNQEAGRLLSRWSQRGWLKRIKRGFYIPVPIENISDSLAIENPWLVVSKIYSPGYVGGISAVKHWDLSEQIYEVVMFFSTKKIHDRVPTLSGIKARIKTIVPDKNFGTKAVWINSNRVLVSDPTRTIVDLLDDPSLAGGMRVVKEIFENYLSSEYKNFDDLFRYSLRMKNRTIFKRLGFLVEQVMPTNYEYLSKLKDQISTGYSNFDPGIRNDRIIRRWNLRIPSSWACI